MKQQQEQHQQQQQQRQQNTKKTRRKKLEEQKQNKTNKKKVQFHTMHKSVRPFIGIQLLLKNVHVWFNLYSFWTEHILNMAGTFFLNSSSDSVIVQTIPLMM